MSSHAPGTSKYVSFFEAKAAWVVFAVALAGSVIATAYYYHLGDVLVYADAPSHLDIARRIIDNKTPGIAQLGSVWLPLPHLLMLPFVVNDTLWHTGLAGSIVSMISYVAAAVLIFKIIKLLTKNAYAGVVGSLIFSFNPNILYMQSIPMTELCLVATMLFGSYFFIKWLYSRQSLHLVIAAFGIFLATLVRYEGWFVLATCTAIILFDGIIILKNYRGAEGRAVLFGTLGSFGIALWALWNLAIFGDPLYFLNGPYSAQAQQIQLAATGHLPTKHNVLLSLTTMAQTVYMNIGTFMLVAVAISFLIVLPIYYKNKKVLFALLILAAPIVLDFGTLVMGITAVSTSLPKTFNIRYGTMAIPLIAVLVGLAISAFRVPKTMKLLAGVAVVVASFMVSVVTLNHVATDSWVASPAVLAYESAIKASYHGGNILASAYVYDPLMQQIGIPLKNYVDEGNGRLWENALVQPQNQINYVLISNGDGRPDPVNADYLSQKQVFDRYYRVAYDKDGFELLIARKLN